MNISEEYFLNNIKKRFEELVELEKELEEISAFSDNDHYNFGGWENYINCLMIFSQLMEEKNYHGADEILMEIIDLNNIKNPRIYYNVVSIVEECLCKVSSN